VVTKLLGVSDLRLLVDEGGLARTARAAIDPHIDVVLGRVKGVISLQDHVGVLLAGRWIL
jgi:hypothetical protein